MKDFIETLALALELEESINITTLEEAAEAVYAVRVLMQLTADIRLKLKLHKAPISLEDTVALSRLIKANNTFSTNTMEVKRYQSTAITSDLHIR